MAIFKNLEKLLNNAKIKYEVLAHKTVYTALDKAKTLRVDPKEVVKTVVLKLGSGKEAWHVLALIPSDKNFDKEKFKKLFNETGKKLAKVEGKTFKAVREIDFAAEDWIKKNIMKSKKGGAVPPFGSLFKIPAFIDKSLLKSKKLVINAGDFNSSVKILTNQLEKAEQYVKGSFSKAKKK